MAALVGNLGAFYEEFENFSGYGDRYFIGGIIFLKAFVEETVCS